MKRTVSVLLLLATLLLAMASCSLFEKVERGETTDDAYKNEGLGLTFQKPDGWTFYTEDQIADMMEISADMWKDEDLLKSADVTTVYEFMAVDGSSGDNVNLTLENLAASGNRFIKMEEYIDEFKKLIKQQTELEYTFSDTEDVKLGEVEFVKLTATCSYNTGYGTLNMTQYIYLKKVGSHMVCVSCTSMSGNDASFFEELFA